MFKVLKNKQFFLVTFLIFSFFLLKSFYFHDPDFGWHIKMGELILTHGIPAKAPFSYTMPSFPFVDHEWFTNVLIYILYENMGWLGLSFIFSLLVTSEIGRAS